MDEHSDGAHRGMTVQMEHTTCEDPLTDEAAVVSEFDFILLFSLVSELYGCIYPTCNCNKNVHMMFVIRIVSR